MENIYKKLNLAIGFLEEHLFEDIDYSQISKLLGMNDNYSKIIFELLTGYTPNEYVRLRRLSESVFMLGHQTIIEVAIACGYDTREGFSRAFKRFHGFSPSHKGTYKFLNKLEYNEQLLIKPPLDIRWCEMPKLNLYGISYNVFSLGDIDNIFLKFKKKYNPEGTIYCILENKGEKLKYTIALKNSLGEEFEKITLKKKRYIQINNPYFDYKTSQSSSLILPDIEIFDNQNHNLLFSIIGNI